MADKSQVDEYQEQIISKNDISIQDAALTSAAMINAFVGSDELKQPLTEAQSNNLEQIGASKYTPEYTPEHERRLESLERGASMGNLTQEQKEAYEYLLYMRPKNAPSKADKLKQIVQKETSKMKAGRTHKYNTRANPETPREVRARLRNDVKLTSEILKGGSAKTKAQPKRKPVLREQPPGANIPNEIQGQPNDVALTSLPTRSNNNLKFPTKTQVQDNEQKYAPVKAKMSRADYMERIEEVKQELSATGALGEQLINRFSGVDGFLNTIQDLVKAGQLPSEIVAEAIRAYLPSAPPEELLSLTEDSLDEEAFIAELGDITPEERDEFVMLAKSIVERRSPSDFPDKGGGPLSHGVDDNESKYSGGDDAYSEFSEDSINSNFYPEYEGGRYRTRGDGGGKPPNGGGKPPNGGGKPPNGSGSFTALQKLNAMAPQIASLLTNNATRPLLIKKKEYNQIYPPLPTNTNLEIVQQAIARSEEDSSILNVYFS